MVHFSNPPRFLSDAMIKKKKKKKKPPRSVVPVTSRLVQLEGGSAFLITLEPARITHNPHTGCRTRRIASVTTRSVLRVLFCDTSFEKWQVRVDDLNPFFMDVLSVLNRWREHAGDQPADYVKRYCRRAVM